MKSKKQTLLILLLLTTFFKGIFWSVLIPAWHGPDEQAHFAQVQYYAEMKKGFSSGNDLSREVATSLKLLGTWRDERGNNKFTYHPEYNVEYSNSFLGIFEEQISLQPKSTRTELVKREAARYPPLFYVISAVGYIMTYTSDLFTRLIATRFISVLLAVATVFVNYLLAKSIFPKNRLFALTTASLVSFQPMFTFLSSTVNNDNLMNLLSSILLWLMLDSMSTGLTVVKSAAMGAIIGLGIITKQLMYPFIPLPLLVIVFNFWQGRKQVLPVKKSLILLLSMIIFGGFIFLRNWLGKGILPSWPQVTPGSPGFNLTLSEYLSVKLPQLYRETLPWYWGVFKWLGVVLPLTTLRLIKVVMILAGIGLIRYVLEIIEYRKKLEIYDWQLLVLTFSSIWFAFWLLYWDFMLVRSIGFSHGLQGRNFFPNLAAHMALFAFGFQNILPKYKTQLLKLLLIFMIYFNFVGFWTFANSYYQTYSLKHFITQVSQYKAWFVKGSGFVTITTFYILSLGKYLISILREKTDT